VPTRFFVDENDLALGRALDDRLGNVVYPGYEDLLEVPRGALDEAWLPVVGAHKLVVVTRDQRIRYRPVEKQMWVEYSVRGFVLTGRRSQSTNDSVAVLMRHWAAIESLVEHRDIGPWMYAVTWGRIQRLRLT
jgi:hypothetical protein